VRNGRRRSLRRPKLSAIKESLAPGRRRLHSVDFAIPKLDTTLSKMFL